MGRNDAWYAIFLATIFASPISIIVTGVIFAVVFLAALSFLIYYGLVSALIYGFGAFLLVGFMGVMMGKESFEKRWYLMFLVPALFFFGWFSDRMGSFGLSLKPMVAQNVMLPHESWVGDATVAIPGSVFVALVALMIVLVMVALVLTFKLHKKR